MKAPVLLASFACLILPHMVPAQQRNAFVPLMGPAKTVADKVTPGGLRYNDAGFDRGRARRIEEKTPNYFRKRGAEHLTGDFQSFATFMVSDPAFIPTEIDAAWERVKKTWLSCGGKYADAAQRFNARQLYICFEAAPFWVEGRNVWAAGATDGANVRVVAVSCDRCESEPQRAALRKFHRLIEWEAGNALALFAGYRPASVSAEVGDRRPCEFF